MGPRYCDHTFVCIKPLENFPPMFMTNASAIEAKNIIPGEVQKITDNTKPVMVTNVAVVACLYCGQIRHVERDGTVTIAVEEGKIIKKRNEPITQPTQKV